MFKMDSRWFIITEVLLTVTVWRIFPPVRRPLNISHHFLKDPFFIPNTFLHNLVPECTFPKPEAAPLADLPAGLLLHPTWLHLCLASLLQLPQLECGQWHHDNVEDMERGDKPEKMLFVSLWEEPLDSNPAILTFGDTWEFHRIAKTCFSLKLNIQKGDFRQQARKSLF